MNSNYLIVIVFAVLGLFIYFGLRKNKSINSQELAENDARRFARLLVSEIKLYENYKVERGLKNNRLYESLRDEIESSRQKYKKRIRNKDFEKYFDEAIVEILADGDRSKLGIVYTSLEK